MGRRPSARPDHRSGPASETLASAPEQQACRQRDPVLYRRIRRRRFPALTLAHGDRT
jgi:hypothetical protein